MDILPDNIRNWYLKLIQPIISFFTSKRLNPNHFTTMGLIVSIVAGYFYGSGMFRIGGIVYLLSGTMDIIDGKIARSSGQVTKFGAVYDSTLDRYSEMFILFGIIFHYSHISGPFLGSLDLAFITAVVTAAALGGSIMVSYVRARAEGLDLECKVGIMQRPERIVYLGLSSMIHEYAMIFVLIIIAILSNFTAIQRLLHVRKQSEAEKKASEKQL
ncbi:CDP-alcohol phosphatidyltransferase family protein [bacterium]|nr:CDP-alcohol phosphatidyltransferase family protein [bacterium]